MSTREEDEAFELAAASFKQEFGFDIKPYVRYDKHPQGKAAATERIQEITEKLRASAPPWTSPFLKDEHN
jgi:hypothetical protein